MRKSYWIVRILISQCDLALVISNKYKMFAVPHHTCLNINLFASIGFRYIKISSFGLGRIMFKTFKKSFDFLFG